MTGGAGADMFRIQRRSPIRRAWASTASPISTPAAAASTCISALSPRHIDAEVTSGSINASHFDAKLAAAIGATQLHAGDAVLFTPTVGYLTGHTLLIVDHNGAAGYQAGADYVVDVTA